MRDLIFGGGYVTSSRIELGQVGFEDNWRWSLVLGWTGFCGDGLSTASWLQVRYLCGKVVIKTGADRFVKMSAVNLTGHIASD